MEQFLVYTEDPNVQIDETLGSEESALDSIKPKLEVDTANYLPKNCLQLIKSRPNCSKEIDQIRNWLWTFSGETEKKGLILSGPPGSGKTAICNIIAKDLNRGIIEFNSSNVKKRKAFRDQLEQSLEYVGIDTGTGINNPLATQYSGKLVVIEEIETIVTCDRSILQEILGLLNNKYTKGKKRNWINKTPLILIVDPGYLKKIKELAKECWTINIQKPTELELELYANSVLLMENTKFDSLDTKKSGIKKVVNQSQSDYRQLSFMLNCLINSKKVLTIKDINLVLDTFDRKIKDYSLFEIIYTLLGPMDTKPMTIEDESVLILQDKLMVGLMMQENYLKFSKEHDIAVYQDISDTVSLSDLLDQKFYETHDPELYEMNSTISSSIPAHRLRPVPVEEMETVLTYPQFFNKNAFIATRKKNTRKLISKMIVSGTGGFDTLEILTDNILEFVKKSQFEEAAQLIKDYNIETGDIDLMYKLSHYNKKIKLTGKNKKLLKSVFDQLELESIQSK